MLEEAKYPLDQKTGGFIIHKKNSSQVSAFVLFP
jgi:hypothetical protein